MEEYSPQDFRFELEALILAAADGKIRDFAHLITVKASRLDETQKRVWLQNELSKLLGEPALDSYYIQKELLPVHLDEMAENHSYWKARQETMTIEAFLAKIPFLQTIVNGTIAAGKVDVINNMLNPVQQTDKDSFASKKLSNKDELLQLVADGYLSVAIKRLEELTKDAPHLHKQILQFSGRLTKLTCDFDLGLIEFEQSTLEANRIREAVLNFIYKLPQQ